MPGLRFQGGAESTNLNFFIVLVDIILHLRLDMCSTVAHGLPDSMKTRTWGLQKSCLKLHPKSERSPNKSGNASALADQPLPKKRLAETLHFGGVVHRTTAENDAWARPAANPGQKTLSEKQLFGRGCLDPRPSWQFRAVVHRTTAQNPPRDERFFSVGHCPPASKYLVSPVAAMSRRNCQGIAGVWRHFSSHVALLWAATAGQSTTTRRRTQPFKRKPSGHQN